MADERTGEDWPEWPPTVWWSVAALVLFAGAFLPVAGSFNAPFSIMDDESLVLHNKLFAEDTPWYKPFTKAHDTHYAPITQVSFRLNFEIFGRDAPWSFRLVSAIFHGLSALILAALLGRLGLKRMEALFVALAWAAHPIACESVAWITLRNNVLLVFFGLAGLYAYVRWFPSWAGLLLGALGFTLACMSKPAGVGWLPVFVALELLGGPDRLRLSAAEYERQRSTAGAFAGLIWRLAPLTLLAGFFAWWGVDAGQIRLVAPPGGHWFYALLTDVEIFARYAIQILAPVRLAHIYGVADIASLADPRLYLFGLGLATAIFVTVFLARHRRRALFGWLWFFGALTPAANLVAISFTMQDRFVYLPMIGLLLVLLETVAGLFEHLRNAFGATSTQPGPSASGLLIGGCYIVALGALALPRGQLWGDPARLMADSVALQPDAGLARIQYAIVLARRAQEQDPKIDPKLLTPAGDDPEEEWVRKLPVPLERLSMGIRLRIEMIRQLERALRCPDAYRYYDPLRVRMIIAKAAVDLAVAGLDPQLYLKSRRALEGWLPPPPPPEGAESGLLENELNAGFRRMQIDGRSYYYRLDMLGQAYLALAESYLHEAWLHETAHDARVAAAAEVVRLTQMAVEACPVLSHAYFVQAGAEIALDNLSERSGDLAAARRHFERAQAALKKVGPDSAQYLEAKRLLKEMKPPGTTSTPPQSNAPKPEAPKAPVPEPPPSASKTGE